MYWLCDIYDNTANNYKKQNDVIEIIQENKRFIERLEKKQLIEIIKIELHQVISKSDWQWYRVNEKEKEKVSQKEIPTDWEREGTKKSNRVRDIMKILEKRKTEKQKFIRNMYMEEMQK